MTGCSTNVFSRDYAVAQAGRTALLLQGALVLWTTGLSGAGKTALATCLTNRLCGNSYHAYALTRTNSGTVSIAARAS